MNNIVKVARKGLGIAIAFAGGGVLFASEIVTTIGEVMFLIGNRAMLAGGYVAGAGEETRCVVNDMIEQINEIKHNTVDNVYSEI